MRRLLVGLLLLFLLGGLGYGLHSYLQPAADVPPDLQPADFLPRDYLLRIRVQNSRKLSSELSRLLVVRRLKESPFHEFYRQFLGPMLAGQTTGLPANQINRLNKYLGDQATFAAYESNSRFPAPLMAVRLDFSGDKSPTQFDATVDELTMNFGKSRRNSTVRDVPVKQVTVEHPYPGSPLTVVSARVDNCLLLAFRRETINQALTKFLPAAAPAPLAGPAGKDFRLNWELAPGLSRYVKRIPWLAPLVDSAMDLQSAGSISGEFEFQPPYFRFASRSELADTLPGSPNRPVAPGGGFGLEYFPAELVYFRSGRVPRPQSVVSSMRFLENLLGGRSTASRTEARKKIERLAQAAGGRYSLGAKLNLSFFDAHLDSGQPSASLPVNLQFLLRPPVPEKFLEALGELATTTSGVEVRRSNQQLRLSPGGQQIDLLWRRLEGKLFFSSERPPLTVLRKRVAGNQNFAANRGYQRLRKKVRESGSRLTYVSFAPLAELAELRTHENLVDHPGYRTLKTTLNFEPLVAGRDVIAPMPGTLTVGWPDRLENEWKTETVGSGDFLVPLLGSGVGLGLATFF